MDIPINRMDALSKLVSIDDKKGFVKITDFPNGYSTSEVIAWHERLVKQVERAIRMLSEPKKFPSAEFEDQNLLNYLELLMGKEMTTLPSLKQQEKQGVRE